MSKSQTGIATYIAQDYFDFNSPQLSVKHSENLDYILIENVYLYGKDRKDLYSSVKIDKENIHLLINILNKLKKP